MALGKYLVLWQDPLNDFLSGYLILCQILWAGYLILGQDPVDDDGQDTSPLILQSAKLRIEKLTSLFSADHGLILEVCHGLPHIVQIRKLSLW